MKKSRHNRWKSINKMTAYWHPYWLTLVVICVLNMINGLLGAYPVKLTQVIINSALDSATGVFGRLPWLILAFYGCSLLGAGIELIASWLTLVINTRIGSSIRKKVYGHMLTLSLDFFDTRSTGDLMSRAIDDVERAAPGVMPVIQWTVSTGVKFAVTTYFLVSMDWRLGLLCLPSSFLMGIIFRISGRAYETLSSKIQETKSEMWSNIEGVITGIREIQAFGREEQEKKHFNKIHRGVYRLAMKYGWIDGSMSVAYRVTSSIAISLVLWQGGIRLHFDKISIGELSAYVIYVGMFSGFFGELSSIYNRLQEVRVSSERVVSVLDSRSSVPEAVEGKILDNSIHNVVFDDVSFGYDPENIVLHDLSFAVNAGESIALVGPSGAGKTTIAKLVMRFYDPLKGSVTINGEDLRDLDLHFLRHHIGTVFQDPFLANATVWENIAYGKPDASESEIIEVAKAAESHEFIEELPNSYDTVIGEQGSRLSGGQRQRLAIARVMLKSPSVIILDEATSSLDSETETKIYTALRRLLSGRTSFIIAHRLSTVVEASKIAVINEGNLVEIGNHHELINLNGMYKKFYDIQFSKPIQRWVEEIII